MSRLSHGKDEVWVVDIMVDPWVHLGSGRDLGGRYHG